MQVTNFIFIAVDIEQFKIVNDVFGTKTGDRLLMDLGIGLLGFKTDDLALITRQAADTYFAPSGRSDSILQLLDQKYRKFYGELSSAHASAGKIGNIPGGQ